MGETSIEKDERLLYKESVLFDFKIGVVWFSLNQCASVYLTISFVQFGSINKLIKSKLNPINSICLFFKSLTKLSNTRTEPN